MCPVCLDCLIETNYDTILQKGLANKQKINIGSFFSHRIYEAQASSTGSESFRRYNAGHCWLLDT